MAPCRNRRLAYTDHDPVARLSEQDDASATRDQTPSGRTAATAAATHFKRVVDGIPRDRRLKAVTGAAGVCRCRVHDLQIRVVFKLNPISGSKDKPRGKQLSGGPTSARAPGPYKYLGRVDCNVAAAVARRHPDSEMTGPNKAVSPRRGDVYFNSAGQLGSTVCPRRRVGLTRAYPLRVLRWQSTELPHTQERSASAVKPQGNSARRAACERKVDGRSLGLADQHMHTHDCAHIV